MPSNTDPPVGAVPWILSSSSSMFTFPWTRSDNVCVGANEKKRERGREREWRRERKRRSAGLREGGVRESERKKNGGGRR